MEPGVDTASWRRNLVLVASVILTVVAALMMSQLDSLRTRLLPTAQPTVVAAQVAEVVFTSTPLPVISLPTAVPPTPTPPSLPTPTASATPVDTPTPSLSPTLLPTITPSETAVPETPQSECGTVPISWEAYRVQRGDTLFALSLRSGASVEQVRQVNCLETDKLVSGTQIFLPPVPPTPFACDPAPPPSWESYTVVRGDTIFKLARSRGVDPAEIQNVNCLFGNKLLAGTQIFLPPSSVSATLPASTAVPGEATATATVISAVWFITSPSNGATVSGILPILGTANFDPAIVQYYKIELAPTDGSAGWITLGATHGTPVTDGVLETLNAAGIAEMQPGEYFLRLVLIENNSNYAGPPYTIQITIE